MSVNGQVVGILGGRLGMPGGTVLTPWHTAYHDGVLARFTVTGDGSATGRIIGNVAFMYLRQQRIYATIDEEDCDESTARAGRTTVAPYNVAGDYNASLAIRDESPGLLRHHRAPSERGADRHTVVR